jgi:hypothetical protein
MPISSARLARLRSRAATYLTDTCAIYYPTYTSDGMGGQSVAWTARGTTISCYRTTIRVSGLSASGDRMEAFYVDELHVASSQAIAPGDRVVMDGRNYTVGEVSEADTARATIRALITAED